VDIDVKIRELPKEPISKVDNGTKRCTRNTIVHIQNRTAENMAHVNKKNFILLKLPRDRKAGTEATKAIIKPEDTDAE